MEQIGKLVTCTRCGTTIFLRYRGTEDHGFRDEDLFENLPREWMNEDRFGHLCPDCAYAFQSFCRDFFGEGKVAASWTFALDRENAWV